MMLDLGSPQTTKITIRADCAVTASSPLPPPIYSWKSSLKGPVHCLSVGGGWSLTGICPSFSHLLSSKNRANFPFHQLPLYWFLSGDGPDWFWVIHQVPEYWAQVSYVKRLIRYLFKYRPKIRACSYHDMYCPESQQQALRQKVILAEAKSGLVILNCIHSTVLKHRKD